MTAVSLSAAIAASLWAGATDPLASIAALPAPTADRRPGSMTGVEPVPAESVDLGLSGAAAAGDGVAACQVAGRAFPERSPKADGPAAGGLEMCSILSRYRVASGAILMSPRASARMHPGRRSGFFSRQFSTSRSNAAGIVGSSVCSGGGGSATICASTADSVGPSKGRLPETS